MKRAAVPIVLLVALSVALQVSALRGWWLNDDPQVLVHASRNSPAETLFDADKWRYLSSANFTPLVTLSFDADLSLAGLNPSFFYGHQWIALTLATVLFFLLLRKATGELVAILAAAIFLASPLATLAVRTLMVRHYVEGLVFALLALLFWTTTRVASDPSPREKRGGRGSRWMWDGFAAFAYLTAMLAKEVYAPLPLLMIFAARVQGDRWLRIANRLVAPGIAAIIYLLWRARILETTGGYTSFTSISEIAKLPLNVLKLALGPVPSSAAYLLAIVAILVIAAKAKQPRLMFGYIVAGGVFAFLPLFAVADSLDWRHAFVAWAVVVAGAGLAMVNVKGVRAAVPLGIALGLMIVAGAQQRRLHDERTRAMIAEGKYVWEKPRGAPTLLARSVGWYLSGLDDLREEPSPKYLLSPDALILDAAPAAEVVLIDAQGRVMKPTAEFLAIIAAERSRFDPSIPIFARVERHGNDFSWSFSPRDGEWRFLSYPLYDEVVLPPTGWQRLPQPDTRQQFRIRRKLTDGRWNATPTATLPARDGAVEVKAGR